MRVVISQRVDVHTRRAERRDALDQAWVRTLDALVGASISVVAMPNHPATAARVLRNWIPQLIVLSGGNDLGQAPERDATEGAMLAYARETSTPLLAVCRGMLMMQHFFKGALQHVEGHVACEHPVYAVEGLSVDVAAPPVMRVNSFHRWGIGARDLAQELQALYVHQDGTVEAARHIRLPWLGVMWHPERTALGDLVASDWIANWLRALL